MSTLRLFYANITLHWGFVVRIPGATAAQPALAIAPPTTVVGAFAASLLRALGYSEGNISKYFVNGSEKSQKAPDTEAVLSPVFQNILDSTIAASMGLHPQSEGPGVGVTMEASRVLAVPYKTGGEERSKFKTKPYSPKFYGQGIPAALPVQAVGVAYAPSTVVDLVWVVDVNKLIEGLPKEDGRNIKVSDIDRIGLSVAYGVTRLGSKEGICSVNVACYIEDPPTVNINKPFQAHTYVPVDCVEPQNVSLVSKIRLWNLKYEPTEYYAPRGTTLTLAYPPTSKYEIPHYILRENCVAYRVVPDPNKCRKVHDLRNVESIIAIGLRGEASERKHSFVS
ncbi:MAG: hypothetical protein QXK14_03865 [Acidilobaceae archaeon]